MDGIFSVALDGPAGAGKSTLAKAMAQATGALYLDTGAMYRAMGLWMLRRGVDPWDHEKVEALLDQPRIGVEHIGGAQKVYLDGEDVSEAIRTPEASMAASAVSASPKVRERLVAMQREIAKGRSVVMDGRDIGTKVLPEATLKIFLTADASVRARRRFRELLEKGAQATYEEVLCDMQKRDLYDSTRAASPLCKAEDAVTLDSGNLTFDETLSRALALLRERMGAA